MNKNCARKTFLQLLARNERGLSTVEYIIILALIAIVGISAWSKFGTTVKSKIEGSQTVIEGM
jgi:Flp pilus assembly pilin Flp